MKATIISTTEQAKEALNPQNNPLPLMEYTEEKIYQSATSNVSAKVPPAVHAKLMREAKEMGMSLSEYARNLLMTEGDNQNEVLKLQRENKEFATKIQQLQKECQMLGNENETLASKSNVEDTLEEIKELIAQLHERDVQSYKDRIEELETELAETNESEGNARKSLDEFRGRRYDCQVERNKAIDEMLEQASKRFALVVHEVTKEVWQPKTVAQKMWKVFKGNPQPNDAWADLKEPEAKKKEGK